MAITALTKSNARSVQNARSLLNAGLAGAYARTIAGDHRASNTRQQAAYEAVIAADGTGHLFARHPVNGCLLAVEA